MNIIENIKSQTAEELLKWEQPSIAIGIIKDGEVVLADAFGEVEIATGRKPNADTLYQIGSCSKAFTAAACAILVDQGKLEWDKPVRSYMPWLKFQDSYTSENVTVRDLLCHRTGLPRHDAYWINGKCTRREMAENLRNMQAAWPFRTEWCYQNTCYVAAGMLIEEISGMTWEKFLQKEILDPLSMDRTYFYIDQMCADENYAKPYQRPLPLDTTGIVPAKFLKFDDESWENGVGAPFGPAGSIISTINDMCKWVKMLLNNGKVGDIQVISEENTKILMKPSMLLSAPLLMDCPEMEFHSYALGWFTETYRGHKMVEHGGNIDGFTALVSMIPDMNLGVICLVNFNDSFNTYATSYEIIDRYLGVENGDWHNRQRVFLTEAFAEAVAGMKAMNAPKLEGTSPTHPIDDYIGTYKNTCYGDFVVTKNGDDLSLAYNKCDYELLHYHYDTYLLRNQVGLFDGMTLKFNTGNDGKIGEIQFAIVLNPAAKDELFSKVVEV